MMNRKVADAFEEIADLLELEGVEFKPRAYRKAASTIAAMDEDLVDLYEEDRIQDVEGVGESMEGKIREIVETGSLEYLEELREELPEGLVDVMRVPGLGPKGAMKLHRELGVDDLEGLKEAAEEGHVEGVEGFGERTQEKVLAGIEMLERVAGRHLISQVRPAAEALVRHLEDHVDRVEVAGSLRRWKETIGDIDVLVTGGDGDVMDLFTDHGEVEEVIARGDTKTSVRLEGDLQVDLRLVEADAFGSALQYFTGSKDHNILLRRRAIGMGLKLSEYGLFEKDGGKRVAGETEEGVYEALDLAWIPPEMREDAGEVDAAEGDDLPDLVTREDLRGDLQMHSDWSDGHDTVLGMARACQDRGYGYMAITDHSGESAVGGVTADTVDDRREEIEAAREELDIRVLDGVEVDVLRDGSLELADDVLEGFDLVIGAVHTNLDLDEGEQTDRLTDALSTDLIHILAHPTGRKIGEREPMALDWDRLLDAALDHDVALEINAYPVRLDLDAVAARRARDAGVALSLGTDAHGPEHLDHMRYGVGVARRAWLEPADILNTLPIDDLLDRLGAD